LSSIEKDFLIDSVGANSNLNTNATYALPSTNPYPFPISRSANNVGKDMKYRKKPALVEATQWFANGDHPQDGSTPIDNPDGPQRITEGKVVRYFRSLHIPGDRFCPHCGNEMQRHGLLDGLNGEEIVCPGDYIVTDPKGKYYALTSERFEAMYEPYESVTQPTSGVET
jgi:hypothetical protein